jgi:sodium/myo-inositol cotransporter 3
MAQRVISVKSVRNGKGAVIAAGLLKLLPPFMICFPGMAARVMYEKCISSNGVDFPQWCETNLADAVEANKAYPYLIIKTLPHGAIGLILVSMIVSMMSALASVFNSASTVFTLDIYKRLITPRASEARLLFVGRVFTCVMIGASFLWLLVIRTQDAGIYLSDHAECSDGNIVVLI